jgi:hypothetical protein
MYPKLLHPCAAPLFFRRRFEDDDHLEQFRLRITINILCFNTFISSLMIWMIWLTQLAVVVAVLSLPPPPLALVTFYYYYVYYSLTMPPLYHW